MSEPALSHLLIFPSGSRRQPYARTVTLYREGFLNCGFLWEMARHDEVFAALLKREGIPRA